MLSLILFGTLLTVIWSNVMVIILTFQCKRHRTLQHTVRVYNNSGLTKVYKQVDCNTLDFIMNGLRNHKCIEQYQVTTATQLRME